MTSSGTKNLRDARSKRAHIRILMEQGYSDSRIAKETGISYQHGRQITTQERQAIAKATGAA